MIRAAVLVVGATLVAGSASAASPRPRVSLAASPVEVHLRSTEEQTLQVTNRGASPMMVDVSRAGFALDLRGRPRVLTSGPAVWLSVRPSRLDVPAGGSATVTVSSSVPRGIVPGDHTALVLLTTEPTRQRDVSVQMQLGVVVTLRVPGRIVHRLEVRSVRVRRAGRARLLDVTVANRGNVTELLGRRSFAISLLRGGRVVARFQPARRPLLPGASALARVHYAGAVRGWLTVLVELRAQPAGGAPVRRRFRIRL